MIIRNLIYILQSENYDFNRFLKFVYRHLTWWNLQKRQAIVWTSKARFLQLVTWLILLAITLMIFMLPISWIKILAAVVVIVLLPFIIGLTLIMSKPLDIILKRRIIDKAKKILTQANLTVIGITGSYGKTSAKEILSAILEKKFSVIKTPENINTNLGIAQFIIDNAATLLKAQVFVVEMGAYRIGDIEEICKMVSPDYAILTGINESHLERFGSIQNTIKAKFELPKYSKKMSVLNFDNKNILDNYSKFDLKNAVGISLESAKNVAFEENFGGIKFEFEGLAFKTKLLAEHNVALIMMCLKIAQELGVDIKAAQQAVASIRPVAHRLEPMYNKTTNVMVIDDSYNGNFDGIKSGISVISRAKGRKIVLTPGLVELGNASESIHSKIGELYSEIMDLVLLIKSPATDYIVSGMQKKNFKKFHIYNDTNEAHGDLANVMKSGDTIIFQNDLTDNYY